MKYRNGPVPQSPYWWGTARVTAAVPQYVTTPQGQCHNLHS